MKIILNAPIKEKYFWTNDNLVYRRIYASLSLNERLRILHDNFLVYHYIIILIAY